MTEDQTPQDKARAIVLMAMYVAGKMNDHMLSVERFQIFKTKSFGEWPPDMQADLAPFGAEMID